MSEVTGGHCVAGVQSVSAVPEPTCPALCFRSAGCLKGVGTYLLGTVFQGCRLFKGCQNPSAGHCIAGCRLLKQCRHLPARHCVAVMQTV